MLTITAVTVLKLIAFYSDVRVRLTGSSAPHAGSVEVLYQGVWGRVDDRKWNLRNAHVVCRQLGYQAAVAAVGGSAFGSGSGPWWLSGVDCKGNETSLGQCTHEGWGGTNNLANPRAAGVVCQQGSNTKNDSDLVLRLNGSVVKSAGRVEVQHAGVWGTVFANTVQAGDVVCRQLGYTGSLHILDQLAPVLAVGPSWISRLSCTGAEQRITDCRYQLLNSLTTYRPQRHTYLVCNDNQRAREFKLRLAGSQREGSGRVEILYRGVWGTVNGRGFVHVTKGAAAVVCRELGYPRALVSGYGSFGAGSGPVWLNSRQLHCFGNETRLGKCNWRIDKLVYRYGHGSDWFVVCDVSGSTDDSPKPPEYVKWTKLNSHQVCFNARRPQRPQRQLLQFKPATFLPTTTGMVSSFKLVHRRGKVSCDSALRNLTESNWGCGNHPNRLYGNGSLNVVITNNRGSLIVPFNASWTDFRGYWYKLPGFDSNSPNITMERGRSPYRVEASSPLTVSYGEALRNWDADNNIGTVCLDIYAEYITTDLQVRLSSSKLSYAGLVEVKYKGVWGTIRIQEQFREQKRRRRSVAVRHTPGPDVICRQLNYSGVLFATRFPIFGSGVGPVWYEEITWRRASLTRCPDDAKNLSQCITGSQLGLVSSASHLRDLNVICKPKGLLSKDLEVRLRGSGMQHAGRVEVKYAGVWGGVSRNGWNIRAANVTCRQLGFPGAAAHFNGASFGPTQVPIWVSSVVCLGTEPKLSNCSLAIQTSAEVFFGFGFAPSDNNAGVLCNPKVKADVEIPLRLRGSSLSNAGRVEVFFAGVWGTISSVGWDLIDAHVVCRQLGFVGALSYGTGPSFGYGPGPVWFANVDCSNQVGAGSSFAKCQRTLLGAARFSVTGSVIRRDVANVVCKTKDRTGGGQCSSSTCLNNGTCVDLGEEHACDCPPGYTGNRCERDTREACHSAPCYNNGTCYDNKDKFVCVCSEGWAGTHCDKDKRTLKRVTINVTFSVSSGSSQVLPCESSTRSPDTFKWKRGGEIISTDSSRIVQLGNGSLLVRNITTIDSGYYLCVADDKILYNVTINVEVKVEVQMALRILNVEYTPDFKNKSSEKYKDFERNFTATMDILYNKTEGYKGVIILAIRNGSTKVDFKVVVVRVIRKPGRKAPEIKVEVSGKIITTIKKKNGFIDFLKVDPDPKTLRVQAEPPVPESPRMGEVKATSVIVMWAEPEYHEYYGIEGYIVGYRKFGSGNKWENMTIEDQGTRRYDLKNLLPETQYYINVAAKNNFGIGVTTAPYTVTTKGEGLAGWAIALIVIMLLLLVAMAVLVLWYRKRRSAQQERLRKYHIDIELHKSKDVSGFESKTNSHAQANHYDEGKVETLFWNPISEIDCTWEEIPKGNLELSKMLGSGAFGAVYKGQVLLDGNRSIECAVKTVKENATEEEKRELWKELEIMSTVGSHPNLVNLIGASTKGDALYIVIEFAANGCLHDYLKNNRTQKNEDKIEACTTIDKETKLMLALDVANGMSYLASKRCIHRDLAARNVLLTKDYRGKIADFGMSRDIYSEGVYEKKTAGKLPIRWMALEAIETFVFAKESDVWSFGVLLWEIETGGLTPWGGLNAKEIVKTLKTGARLEKPEGCVDEIYEIMTNCWDANPKGRPDFKDLSDRFEKLLNQNKSNC